MAWLEKKTRYRLRDMYEGERKTMVRNLGIWKATAETALADYKRAVASGFVPIPDEKGKPPHLMAHLRAFLSARAQGGDSIVNGLPVPMEQLIDFYFVTHGPDLKGGISTHYKSQYVNLKHRLDVLKQAWAGRKSDDITSIDVRDYLAPFKTVATRLKYLSDISNMFKLAEAWNEEGILKPAVRLPLFNPGEKARSKMKPEEKQGKVNKRVLAPEEWDHFKKFLKPRARQICEIALQRFLRLADIRRISRLSIRDEMIEGLQEKTGVEFSVPVMSNHPSNYNFTNFRRDFFNAQVAAGMEYPGEHPLHFTPRDLRRTGATWAYRYGKKELPAIQKMLGHKKITTTMLYLRIDETDLRSVAKTVDRIAMGPLPKKEVSKKLGTPVGNRSDNADK